ncbi:MAG TPA: phosphoadenylyl-sulfate reductase, partial [Chitinophagaceae bacterium]|nr:phosphoadenylyl-sulfate reductase [Chitinophagaceae bacterium]
MIETLNNLSQITHQIDRLNIRTPLSVLAAEYSGRVVLSSSFSYEDQVIAHEILSNNLPISIFTLDTGRMFAETYSVWSNTNEKYNTHIKAFYPKQDSLENFIAEKGPNSFYESVENRKSCCFIRKVEPLKRALAGNAVWITGLRAEHSADRHNLPMIEWDESNQIIKYHPILHWTTD